SVDVGCSPIPDGHPWEEAGTVDLEQIGEENGLSIWAAEYPLPGPTEGLWSQWGQGTFASNGLHYSGVGDHRGVDGNSYLFEYDPMARRLSRILDVLSLVDHETGTWGFGKLHSQMVTDACGRIWAHT